MKKKKERKSSEAFMKYVIMSSGGDDKPGFVYFTDDLDAVSDEDMDTDNADDEASFVNAPEGGTPDVDAPIDKGMKADNVGNESASSAANELYWWCS